MGGHIQYLTIGNNPTAEHLFNRFDIDLENMVLTEVNPDFLVDILNIFCGYKNWIPVVLRCTLFLLL
ncbi:MAG: hypothetical protein CR994_06810 [Maribacter sp.]|nr:MAG: hypothetical protein CR994_06810 [Maribacter sp.]